MQIPRHPAQYVPGQFEVIRSRLTVAIYNSADLFKLLRPEQNLLLKKLNSDWCIFWQCSPGVRLLWRDHLFRQWLGPEEATNQ